MDVTQNRDCKIYPRLRPDERELLERAAKLDGERLNTWARLVLLGYARQRLGLSTGIGYGGDIRQESAEG